MKSTNETKTDSNENKPNIEFVRILTKSELGSLAIECLIYGWAGGIFLAIFFAMANPQFFSTPFLLYLVWFLFPLLFIIALLRRNQFLVSHFNEKNHRKFLEFTYRWRTLIPVLTGSLILYYIVYGFYDAKFFMIPFVVFLYMVPIFRILDRPLTEEGEIFILFEMLTSTTNNYNESIEYWKRLAKKIEKMFRVGEISVARKDLVYYFSIKLLKTNEDISNDLECIRDWMLGRRRSCFEAITHIIPKERFIQEEKVPLSLFKNSDKVLRSIIAGILILAIIFLIPTSIDTFLKTFFAVLITILVGVSLKE